MKTIEQLTASLKHAGIDPSGYGNRLGESLESFTSRVIVTAIVEADVRVAWPAIEAADLEREISANFIPVPDGVRESI